MKGIQSFLDQAPSTGLEDRPGIDRMKEPADKEEGEVEEAVEDLGTQSVELQEYYFGFFV